MNSRIALTVLSLSSFLFSGCVASEFQAVESRVEPAVTEATGSAQLDEIEAELMILEITEEDFSDL